MSSSRILATTTNEYECGCKYILWLTLDEVEIAAYYLCEKHDFE